MCGAPFGGVVISDRTYGARCVHVEFGEGFLSKHDCSKELPERALWVRRHRANWVATRLFGELRK